MQKLEALIRNVPDFPKPGIQFKDITPLLADPEGLKLTTDTLASRYKDRGITKFVGIESRGFIFAAPVAYALGCGVALIRKPGKLPCATYDVSYALEYGEDTLELHKTDLGAHDRVVIVDDLLATGGTAKAALQLCHKAGAEVVEVAVLIELLALNGRKRLEPSPVHALISY